MGTSGYKVLPHFVHCPAIQLSPVLYGPLRHAAADPTSGNPVTESEMHRNEPAKPAFQRLHGTEMRRIPTNAGASEQIPRRGGGSRTCRLSRFRPQPDMALCCSVWHSGGYSGVIGLVFLLTLVLKSLKASCLRYRNVVAIRPYRRCLEFLVPWRSRFCNFFEA